MAYGTNGTYGECVVEYTTKRPTVISIDSRQYLFSNKTGNKNMYSEEFLKNHNSSAALRTEQKRAEEVDTVAREKFPPRASRTHIRAAPTATLKNTSTTTFPKPAAIRNIRPATTNLTTVAASTSRALHPQLKSNSATLCKGR